MFEAESTDTHIRIFTYIYHPHIGGLRTQRKFLGREVYVNSSSGSGGSYVHRGHHEEKHHCLSVTDGTGSPISQPIHPNGAPSTARRHSHRAREKYVSMAFPPHPDYFISCQLNH